MEQGVGREVGLEELALCEDSSGKEGDRRRCALLLLNRVWLVYVHPSRLETVFPELPHYVVLLGSVDNLSLVLVRRELIFPLVLELSHALLVGLGAFGGRGC